MLPGQLLGMTEHGGGVRVGHFCPVLDSTSSWAVFALELPIGLSDILITSRKEGKK